MATINIVKKARGRATAKFVGTGSAELDLADLAVHDETFDRANCKVTLAHMYFAVGDVANVSRNSNVIVALPTGSLDQWSFTQETGFVLDEFPTSNVVVDLGANEGTMIITLHKTEGYNIPDNQALESWQKA